MRTTANQIYIECKSMIKCHADMATTTDLPMRRQDLNDYLDYIDRRLGEYELKDNISKKQKNLFMKWLTNYTIKRHIN